MSSSNYANINSQIYMLSPPTTLAKTSPTKSKKIRHNHVLPLNNLINF